MFAFVEEDVPLTPGSCAYVYRVVDEDEDSDAESLIEDMWGKQSDFDDDDDYEGSVDEEEVTEDEDSVPDPAEDDTGHGADDPMSNTSLLPEDVQCAPFHLTTLLKFSFDLIFLD